MLEDRKSITMSFNRQGFTVVDESNEEIFKVDGSGVYIKDLYLNEDGGINDAEEDDDIEAKFSYTISYGTGEPNNSTLGTGTNGSIYF